ncbi:MAG: pyridoxamine 5'-phosphate oxidase family protein [Acidimicrobiales bacterium]
MSIIPSPAQTLLGSDAVAHVWTRNADGSPQGIGRLGHRRGDEILFGTSDASEKAKNLRRDPSIILSIEDTERNARGFQRHLLISGRAELEPGPNPVLMDRLAMKYAGLAKHPLALRDSPSSLIVRVKIERISGEGPWVEA